MTDATLHSEARARDLAEFHRHAVDCPAEALMPLARHAAALERLLEEANRRADFDPLTGLWSRRRILEALRIASKRVGRSGQPLAAILLDLDHFKRVNDERGHLAGDEVLRGVGRALRECLRETDAAGRYGGEELLVVTDSTDPGALAEKLRKAIEALDFSSPSGPFKVTASLGVATFRGFDPAIEVEIDRLKLADAALYRAKAGGRNRVEVAGRSWRVEVPR